MRSSKPILMRANVQMLGFSQPHPSQSNTDWDWSHGLEQPEGLGKAMPPRGAGLHPVLNLPVGSKWNFFLFLCQAGKKLLCCCLYWIGLKFAIFVIFRSLSGPDDSGKRDMQFSFCLLCAPLPCFYCSFSLLLSQFRSL